MCSGACTLYKPELIYVIVLMKNYGVLDALTEDDLGDTATTAAIKTFKKMNEKHRSDIVLILGEEPATQGTSL